MSELRPNHADPAAALSGRGQASGFVRTHALVANPAALAAARDAVHRVPFSREALRAQVVRFAAAGRDHGASVTELTEALQAALAPALANFPAALADELRVHVGWWAAHGYHRAD